ncbi:histidinol-phosphatase [Aureibaculum sp. 2210JD6-5]|uniref:PHP domain-containing protein n=1 Tax=Aureibaculum sp. 2210JD6-5 TaxID=3103957 RepID=UPI002AAD5ABC|nr:histidinol-phosphatase [Aureibaculum sp. 2210JD6-5]MDY7394322.1 histidinol-phosphatase [Aureibaculum sp. 2210JD6-5]
MSNYWKTLNLFFVLISLGLTGCVEQQDVTKTWYKGNLHAHSYWSDGDDFPEMIMDWYKANDYDFTVLSDHNTLNEGDKWITISNKKYLQQGFKNYLSKYGEDWLEHRLDSVDNIQVKLKTYAEYKSLFEDENFIMIPSEEVTTGFEGKPIHINATNIQEKITPLDGTSKVDVIQKNINAILAQRKEFEVPIMPHINHPNFGFALTADDFVQLNNVQFFEVYNGHPAVFNEGDSTHLGTEQIWDIVNTAYAQQNKPLLYGIATDDSHQYHQFGKKYSNAGRGWVMVQADSLHASNIITAMEMGNFYASTGVVLEDIKFESNNLTVEVKPEPNVNYKIEFIGVSKSDKKSKIIKSIDGTKASLDFKDSYLFVRAKVISDKTNKNFFDENEYEKAWIQPVMFR